jgi:hypothetical protein
MIIDLGCPPERRLTLLRPAQRVPHSSDVLRSSQRINACRQFAWLLKADSPRRGPLLSQLHASHY